MLTFDDAVTALNYEYIEEGINGRVNPDGCPVAATFYVSHGTFASNEIGLLCLDHFLLLIIS